MRTLFFHHESHKELEVAVSGFRSHTETVLGDIINSDPMYSKNEDFGYADLPSGTPGQATYANYISLKADRTAAVYVGANDGMLHSLRADVGDTNSGKELFAFTESNKYNKDASNNDVVLPYTQSPKVGTAQYNITLTANVSTFSLIAAPVTDGSMEDDACGSFTLNQLGQKNVVYANLSAEECWNK